jgi:uncharacterized HAD superfamily protein
MTDIDLLEEASKATAHLTCRSRKVVLVDIDGTIAQATEERLKYLLEEPKNWEKFLDMVDTDLPKEEILDLVRTIKDRYEIIFCTGRSEKYRRITMHWLKNHFHKNAEDYLMLMRPNGDHRADTEMKPLMLKAAGIELKDIAFVLEDRKTVTKMWRDMGLTCLQVVEGDY